MDTTQRTGPFGYPEPGLIDEYNTRVYWVQTLTDRVYLRYSLDQKTYILQGIIPKILLKFRKDGSPRMRTQSILPDMVTLPNCEAEYLDDTIAGHICPECDQVYHLITGCISSLNRTPPHRYILTGMQCDCTNPSWLLSECVGWTKKIID